MAIATGRLEIETADHVVLRYALAGAGNRGFAALVDLGIATLIAAGIDQTYQVLRDNVLRSLPVLTGLEIMAILLLGWSYFVLVEWLWNGQSVGKRMFGLRVITDDGQPARFVAVLVRNLVRVLDFLPIGYGVGLVAIIVSSRSQRLGDLAAGTYVVRSPRPRQSWTGLKTWTGSRPDAKRDATPADIRVLSGEAQRLVREFMLRESRLDPRARAAVARQIAQRVRPMVPSVGVADDAEFIHAVARALRAAAPEE